MCAANGVEESRRGNASIQPYIRFASGVSRAPSHRPLPIMTGPFSNQGWSLLGVKGPVPASTKTRSLGSPNLASGFPAFQSLSKSRSISGVYRGAVSSGGRGLRGITVPEFVPNLPPSPISVNCFSMLVHNTPPFGEGFLLKDSKFQPRLTLIDCGNGNSVAGDACSESIVRVDDIHAAKMEARAFEASQGKNPYSDYILRCGRRPDRNEAAGMGRMMNTRLRAADGTLQPVLTKAEKVAWRDFHRQKAEKRLARSAIRKLRAAIHDLAEALISPSELAREIDVPAKDAQLALDYITRFAEELRGDEAGKSPRST